MRINFMPTNDETRNSANQNTTMTNDKITITTDEEALGLVIERAGIEIDELYETGEEEFAKEATEAHRTVSNDFQEAKEEQ